MSGTATIPSAAQDVVGVFDSNFNQLFQDARPIKVTVKEDAKLMNHTVESGSTVTDHRVVQQIEITLSMIHRAETMMDTYNEIRGVFNGVNTISVQTNTGLYFPMMIEAMPHEEDPKHFDTITMNMKLKEIIFATSKSSPLPDAPQNGGNKNAAPATNTQTDAGNKTGGESVAHSWFPNAFGGH